MKPTAFPFAAPSRPKSTPGGGVSNPAPSPRATPRRPEVEKAGCNDVAIYELTGPWSTYRWLCLADVAVREAQGWTARKRQDAPRVDSCDDCELRRQAKGTS